MQSTRTFTNAKTDPNLNTNPNPNPNLNPNPNPNPGRVQDAVHYNTLITTVRV